jgi:hypothetical protein
MVYLVDISIAVARLVRMLKRNNTLRGGRNLG